MRNAQFNNSQTQQNDEEALQQIRSTQQPHLIIRNDWKDFIATNDVADSVVMARATDVLSILAEDEGPVDQVYSIVILPSDQPIDDGPHVDWIQT